MGGWLEEDALFSTHVAGWESISVLWRQSLNRTASGSLAEGERDTKLKFADEHSVEGSFFQAPLRIFRLVSSSVEGHFRGLAGWALMAGGVPGSTLVPSVSAQLALPCPLCQCWRMECSFAGLTSGAGAS